jgi:hypothetical protein
LQYAPLTLASTRSPTAVRVAGSTALADVAAWITAVIAFASAAATTAMAVVDPLAGRVDHGRKEADFADFARRPWRLSAAYLNSSPRQGRWRVVVVGGLALRSVDARPYLGPRPGQGR